MKSLAMTLYLEPFKAAAAEGAAVELKLRLLAGTIPALENYAHQQKLEGVEDELAKHFGDALSAVEKETLILCRQLRNKVLHSDFRAARDRLQKLGTETQSGGVVKVDLSEMTIEAVAEKIAGVRAGTEGTRMADTPSTAAGGVYG
jgi:hypothetical protein